MHAYRAGQINEFKCTMLEAGIDIKTVILSRLFDKNMPARNSESVLDSFRIILNSDQPQKARRLCDAYKANWAHLSRAVITDSLRAIWQSDLSETEKAAVSTELISHAPEQIVKEQLIMLREFLFASSLPEKTIIESLSACYGYPRLDPELLSQESAVFRQSLTAPVYQADAVYFLLRAGHAHLNSSHIQTEREALLRSNIPASKKIKLLKELYEIVPKLLQPEIVSEELHAVLNAPDLPPAEKIQLAYDICRLAGTDQLTRENIQTVRAFILDAPLLTSTKIDLLCRFYILAIGSACASLDFISKERALIWNFENLQTHEKAEILIEGLFHIPGLALPPTFITEERNNILYYIDREFRPSLLLHLYEFCGALMTPDFYRQEFYAIFNDSDLSAPSKITILLTLLRSGKCCLSPNVTEYIRNTIRALIQSHTHFHEEEAVRLLNLGVNSPLSIMEYLRPPAR